ncbi:MAG: hypothetical protein SFX73_28970 [Kofleriaceae bacterium]|nr:hypothetical protein [Kofleriaceae bacterium]
MSADAAARMQRVLRDPSGRLRGAYPPAPALTCEILRGLDGELAEPSVRARYQSLASENWDNHPPLARVVDSLGRDSWRYTLIALTSHWNTDVKILALRAFQRVPSRLLINADAATDARLAQTERAALRFLLLAVETTPRTIPGSENATIHGVYMDALIATLDLLSGERGPGGALRTNALTDAELAEALAAWRRHAPP